MKCNIKIFLAFICSILIAGTPFGSMAADKTPAPPFKLGISSGGTVPPVPPAPVTPPGNDGLLSGMTPGSYKIPSGWSLVRSQDFENGCGKGENCELWDARFKTERAHGGATSVGGTYSHGQSHVGWLLDGGQVGSYTELYISFYEFVESQALFNDEFWMAQIFVNNTTFQEVIFDWYWAPGFNKPTATLYAVPQGNRENNMPIKSGSPAAGAWVQWEIHYRQNTPGNSDGFIRIYRDGTAYGKFWENQNINGKVSMNSSSVQLGGIYTKGVWMMDHPTCSVCSTYPGNGTDYCSEYMRLPGGATWSSQPFSNPVCNPNDPPLPSFNRYFDDIIVIKK